MTNLTLPQVIAKVPPYPEFMVPPVDSTTRSLTNLSNTCYFNSILQPIAHCNFDVLFFHPEIVAETNASSLFPEKTINDKPTREQLIDALRRQFCAVINTMREAKSKAPVSLEDLGLLYRLLNECGWDKDYRTQQDPHEFFLFLFNLLSPPSDSSPPNIKISTLTTRSYTTNEEVEVRSFGRVESSLDLQLSLTEENGQLRKTQTEENGQLREAHAAIHEQIQQCRHGSVQITTKKDGTPDGYIPDGLDYPVETTTETFYLDPAPEYLLVQLKRYAGHLDTRGNYRADRIGGAIPTEPKNLSKEVHIDIYEQIEVYNQQSGSLNKALRLKEVRSYEPFVVVNHRGSSTSSGHYTASVNQTFDSKPNQWVTYDDSSRPKSVNESAIVPCSYLIFYKLRETTPIEAQIADRIIEAPLHRPIED